MENTNLKTSEPPKFIVIEGPIGVGKSSLARRLAESFGCDMVREKAEHNPFLEHFYQHPNQSALPVQLHFLTERAKQWDELCQNDLFSQGIVCDFMLEKDPLFARLNLSDEELKLYEKMYEILSIQQVKPDLVIYLQAPVETLQSRVKKRGVAYEKSIDESYLQKLSDAYTRFFHQYDDSPLLIVNAADINPIDNDADYEQLLQHICSVRYGRHFINPLPIAVSAY
ncbi:MAG: deoxyadenosine kinase [Cycloclasticus sp. symbiont of Poecilosclerida sp. M]|nr:MAG: deoxyadenosine kinase [Cycloclasticus sp. symbiont of Poecilosclerida sp. M]